MDAPRLGDLRPPTRYILPDDARHLVAGSFGELVQTDGLAAALGDSLVAAVGDVVSETLHDLGITPRLFVCDYKTKRGDDDPHFRTVLGAWGDREVRVHNPAAMITREAWDAVRDAFADAGTTRIVVDGEEDLIGIPCFLEAPIGAKVVYGKPGEGAVVVTVDAAFQETVAEILAQFRVE